MLKILEKRSCLFLAPVLFFTASQTAQGEAGRADQPRSVYDSKLFEGLRYRSLGFSRGGRSTAVAGVPGHALTFYFGSTGGGAWKTEDAGTSWQNISDGDFRVGSIGAIAVAPSDPNVIYVGTGSACPRGNVSPGIGIYRSTDAGKHWTHIGLPEAGQIGRIQIHPRDPELVYVAVLGNVFGPTPERGVYRSRDGGANWEKVLFVNDRTGAVEISMDIKNPRILYAAFWTFERKPWTTVSGSKEGGIYKTSDSGDNWEKLSGGLPDDLVGRIGLSVSGANPDRVWAIVEANRGGGIYRSDDAGESWRKINDEARLRQRPWYYNHIHADPEDENTVYVLNTGMYKSTNGGSSFERIRTPHGDNHDLWISPVNNRHMIEGNDGGANVSFNGGRSWSTQQNQPTAEIYRLTVDDQFPYRVYGAQQDNSTISVPSRGGSGVVPDWYSVGGCESGHVAVDPRSPDIIYAGCYGGNISRVNRQTDESRQILIYPQLQLGQAPRDLKYRFQWNAPIRISPHDPEHLYHTSQYVHRSTDEGQSWQTISPDLTRNDKDRQGFAGEPITHDSTGVEVYGVVFAFEISPHRSDLLWSGSDDGLVHISRDGGARWEDITPPAMPDWGTVNMIELSSHDPGRAFIAVHRYRENDFSPYIFRTSDYGKSWERLTDGSNGIPENHFVRVVREDPDRQGLLYAGTEFGLYLSFDDGKQWQPFQLNLPVTPVTDLAVHQQDLVVSTQGRAFWILDDLTPLHQLSQEIADSDLHLYQPRQAFRAGGGAAEINYHLKEAPEGELKLEILDASGEVIATFRGKAGAEDDDTDLEPPPFAGGGRIPRLPVKAGLNRFRWNLRYPRIEIPRGVILWGGTAGAKIVPGTFQARLTIEDWSQTQPFEVKLDPRVGTTQSQLQEQFDLLAQIRERIEKLYTGLGQIRDIRSQVEGVSERLRKAEKFSDQLKEASESLLDRIKEVEQKLTQTQSQSNQDALNFPPLLDNQLMTLYGYVADPDTQPTAGAYERFDDLKKELSPLLEAVDQIVTHEVEDFNQMVQSMDLGPVLVSK